MAMDSTVAVKEVAHVEVEVGAVTVGKTAGMKATEGWATARAVDKAVVPTEEEQQEVRVLRIAVARLAARQVAERVVVGLGIAMAMAMLVGHLDQVKATGDEATVKGVMVGQAVEAAAAEALEVG